MNNTVYYAQFDTRRGVFDSLDLARKFVYDRFVKCKPETSRETNETFEKVFSENATFEVSIQDPQEPEYPELEACIIQLQLNIPEPVLRNEEGLVICKCKFL